MGIFDKVKDAIFEKEDPAESTDASVDEKLASLKKQEAGRGAGAPSAQAGRSSSPSYPKQGYSSQDPFNPFAGQGHTPSQPQQPSWTPVPTASVLSSEDEAACLREVEGWLDPNRYKALDGFQRMRRSLQAHIPDPMALTRAVFDALTASGIQPEDVQREAEQMLAVVQGHFQRLGEALQGQHQTVLVKKAETSREIQQAIEAKQQELEALKQKFEQVGAELEAETRKTATLDQIEREQLAKIAAMRTFYENAARERVAGYQHVLTLAAGMPPLRGTHG